MSSVYSGGVFDGYGENGDMVNDKIFQAMDDYWNEWERHRALAHSAIRVWLEYVYLPEYVDDKMGEIVDVLDERLAG